MLTIPKAFGITQIVEQETETISAEDFLGKELRPKQCTIY